MNIFSLKPQGWNERDLSTASICRRLITIQSMDCNFFVNMTQKKNFLSIKKSDGMEIKGPKIDRFFGQTPLSSSINRVHGLECGSVKRC
jgi:hypothetical protein